MRFCVILRKKGKKKSSPQPQIGTKTHKLIILRGTTRIPDEKIHRALNKAYNGAARFCLIENFQQNRSRVNFKILFRGKAFSRRLFLSFRKNNFYSPGQCVVYINNKRDNNIIKSNFQDLFRLKIAEGVI